MVPRIYSLGDSCAAVPICNTIPGLELRLSVGHEITPTNPDLYVPNGRECAEQDSGGAFQNLHSEFMLKQSFKYPTTILVRDFQSSFIIVH
jgi:hypothetical protein